MPTPIKTNVRNALETAIEAMATPTYYFDWGSTSFNRDLTLTTFPNFYILIPTEENLDFDSGETNSQEYDNTSEVQIVVHAQNLEVYEDPQREIEDQLYRCEDDLKKLFADSGQVGSPLANAGATSFMYMGYESETFKSNDIYVPKKRIFKFRLQYNQDRLNPDQIAC